VRQIWFRGFGLSLGTLAHDVAHFPIAICGLTVLAASFVHHAETSQPSGSREYRMRRFAGSYHGVFQLARVDELNHPVGGIGNLVILVVVPGPCGPIGKALFEVVDVQVASLGPFLAISPLVGECDAPFWSTPRSPGEDLLCMQPCWRTPFLLVIRTLPGRLGGQDAGARSAIVASTSDPIASGITSNLAIPEGNITGAAELGCQRIAYARSPVRIAVAPVANKKCFPACSPTPTASTACGPCGLSQSGDPCGMARTSGALPYAHGGRTRFARERCLAFLADRTSSTSAKHGQVCQLSGLLE
jgi:hypothetical protein